MVTRVRGGWLLHGDPQDHLAWMENADDAAMPVVLSAG